MGRIEASNRITVLFLHANNEDVGGADYCLFKLVSSIDRSTFRPIVCLSLQTPIIDLYAKEGIDVRIIDMLRLKYTGNIYYLIKVIFKFAPSIIRIIKLIRGESVRIVHGNDLLDIYGSIAGKVVRVPTIQHVRRIITSRIAKLVINSVVCQINDVVIAVSDGVAKAMFSEMSNRLRGKVVICYDWLDMKTVGHTAMTSNVREQLGVDADTFVVGAVGRLEPSKGQHIFVEAASHVLKSIPNVLFLIVGDKVYGRGREYFLHELKMKCFELRILDKIVFAGHREDIYNIYKCCDVIVHSAIKPDCLPGVVMEAMYAARPVVAANTGGVPEEVIQNETGLLYPPGDVRKMAEAIIYLLKHRDIAKVMGEKGREYVMDRFRKDLICPQVENIYYGLAG